MSIPAFFDVGGSLLIIEGLKTAPVSIQVMMRSVSIITTVFVNKNHQIGICWNLVGLALISISQVLNNISKSETSIGLLLIFIGQIIVGIQIVFEEYQLEKLNLDTDIGSSIMGVWCIIFVIFIFYPIGMIGDQLNGETLLEDFIMITNNQVLFLFVLCFLISIWFYNVFVIQTIKYQSGVQQMLIDILRTSFTFIIDLIVYQFISNQYGEPWLIWSWVQLLGFCICLQGTQIFKGFSTKFITPQSEEQSQAEIELISEKLSLKE